MTLLGYFQRTIRDCLVLVYLTRSFIRFLKVFAGVDNLFCIEHTFKLVQLYG